MNRPSVLFPHQGRWFLAVVIAFSCCSLASWADPPEGEKGVPSADSSSNPPADDGARVPIFDGKSLAGWRIIDTFDFEDHGQVTVQDGQILLSKGDPATGISWTKELPRINYQIDFQAKRLEGSDFFCGLTFPVKEEYCTLILGGWGGQIVGLSNLDGFSAIENATTQAIEFQNGQWYRVRLRVTDQKITIWLDDQQLIDVDTTRHKFSIWWEQEPVRPLGIVTWRTSGAIKDLQMRKLP